MARVPYKKAADAGEETRAVLESVDANIVRLLANAEGVAPTVFALIGRMLTKLELDPRLREQAILLVADTTGATYEWAQHLPIAEWAGVSAAQVAAIQHRELEADCFDEPSRATLAWVAEQLADGRPSKRSFERLTAAGYGSAEIVELVLVVGCYRMLADAMTALEVDEDPPVSVAQFAERMDFMNR
jgi:alkylhydroperoxidase family enzyme